MTESNSTVEKTETEQVAPPPVVQDDTGHSEYEQELLKKKRVANAEAKAERERREALELELKAYKDKEKTEIQKAQEDAAKAKQEADSAKRELANQKILNAAIKTGSLDPEYVAWRAQKENADLSDPEYVKQLKEQMPHLFTVAKPQVPAPTPTGAGGPNIQSNGSSKKEEEIKDLQSQINKCKDTNEKIFLRRALKKLMGD